MGTIETSDGGTSYTPMVCAMNCFPLGETTTSIMVDGDANSSRKVNCLNGAASEGGNICTLTQPDIQPTPLNERRPVRCCRDDEPTDEEDIWYKSPIAISASREDNCPYAWEQKWTY